MLIEGSEPQRCHMIVCIIIYPAETLHNMHIMAALVGNTSNSAGELPSPILILASPQYSIVKSFQTNSLQMALLIKARHWFSRSVNHSKSQQFLRFVKGSQGSLFYCQLDLAQTDSLRHSKLDGKIGKKIGKMRHTSSRYRCSRYHYRLGHCRASID